MKKITHFWHQIPFSFKFTYFVTRILTFQIINHAYTHKIRLSTVQKKPLNRGK